MKKLALLLAFTLPLSLFSACENSKPKKTSDAPAAETVLETTGGAGSGSAIRPPSAEKAPDFNLTDIHGKPFRLSDYKGKVIILDFWATWCPPCKAEIPFFIELEKQYGKDGLAVLGAALDDPGKVKNFYKAHAMNYPVAVADQELSMVYGGIQGIPTTFVIDRDGYIREKFVGYRPKQVFEDLYLSIK
jgi:cytochrome c biogenesis protein CcmG/thiol:disulfide interchange protein DsbE